MAFIYRITNTITKKCYVGETKQKDVTKRWKQHKNLMERGKGCPALRDAIKKYGFESFKFEVLLICFDEDRFKYEVEYIAKYQCQAPLGYNILKGGVGGAGFAGKTHTNETKEKLRKIHTKRYENNDELRLQTSIAVKEGLKNINIRERLIKSEKWKAFLLRPRIGRKHSNETKEKISQRITEFFAKNKSNKNVTPCNIRNHQIAMAKASGKAVIQYDKQGNMKAEYPSISEAARCVGISSSSIKFMLTGKTQSAGGYIWKLKPKVI